LARQYTETVREADAPGQIMLIGTKVDMLQIETTEGSEVHTVPYFEGIDQRTGEKVAENVGALGYIETSCSSMFGIKNALDACLPHVITPRTAGQNVRGVLRAAGMLFGWLANSLVNSSNPGDDESFDGEEDEATVAAAAGQKEEMVIGEFSEERRIHVYVCGDHGSGKTTLVRRYLRQPFVAEAPTAPSGTLRFAMRGRPYAPQDYDIIVWDCPTVLPMFLENNSKSTIVFAVDVTRADSIKTTIQSSAKWKLISEHSSVDV